MIQLGREIKWPLKCIKRSENCVW